MKTIMENWKKYSLNESGLSRIYGHIMEHESAILSAFRDEYSNKENYKRNRELKAKLLNHGYAITKVDGAFIENIGKENSVEVREQSFFISNRYDDDNFFNVIQELSEEYEQDSVLMIPQGGKAAYLYGTSKTGEYPTYHAKANVGDLKMGREAEFMSKVKGRPFTFSEALDVIENYSRNSRWAIKKLSEKKKK